MTNPLDILRAPAPRSPIRGQKKAFVRAAPLGRSRLDGPETGSGDIAQAVAAFNAEHPVHELLASAGVELHEQGREWHTVNGCPLPGCTSAHDAFRVHIDRKAGDTRGPQWACRKCSRGGDALRLAMYLAARDPHQKGETARFLREQGYLQSPVSRAGAGTRQPARTRDFAQDRSGHVKATQHTIPRKESPASATQKTGTRPCTQQGQVPVVPAPFAGKGQAAPSVSCQGPTPVGGRGEVCPAPAYPGAGKGELVPADPLRWSRTDALAVFGRHPTQDEIETLEERAGIIEYDAGLTRQQAERAALAGHKWPPPLTISENLRRERRNGRNR